MRNIFIDNGKIKKILICFMTLLCVQLIISMDVSAVSKSKKARKAYRNYLERIYEKEEFKQFEDLKGDIKFSIVDLNGDKIPEMIVTELYTWPERYYVYTYRKGKVKKLKKLDYFEGGMIMKIYPSKHIVETMEGDSWDSHRIYYKVTGTRMKQVLSPKLNHVKSYELTNGKYQFKNNTAKNRKKI